MGEYLWTKKSSGGSIMRFGEFEFTFGFILMIAGFFCIVMMFIAYDKTRWFLMFVFVVLAYGLNRKIQERRSKK